MGLNTQKELLVASVSIIHCLTVSFLHQLVYTKNKTDIYCNRFYVSSNDRGLHFWCSSSCACSLLSILNICYIGIINSTSET